MIKYVLTSVWLLGLGLFPNIGLTQSYTKAGDSPLMCADRICNGDPTGPVPRCLFADPTRCNSSSSSAAFASVAPASSSSQNNDDDDENKDEPSFPFVVALLDATLETACSGSLVSRNTVLTAAHCVCDKGIEYVFVGDNSDDRDSGWTFPVKSRQDEHDLYYRNFCAPEADRNLWPDLALLCFINDEPLHSDFILEPHPVLDSHTRLPIRLVVAGFGANEDDASGGEKRYATLPPPRFCSQQEQEAGQCKQDLEFIVENSESERVDTCLGDSGGPAFDDRWLLVALTRRGLDHDEDDPCGYGGIYSRIYIRDFENDRGQDFSQWLYKRLEY